MGRACHISRRRESVKPFTRSGYLREGKGGIQSFDWKNWNWTLPWKTTRRRKNCCIPDIRLMMEHMATFLKASFSWPLHQIVRLLLCTKINLQKLIQYL